MTPRVETFHWILYMMLPCIYVGLSAGTSGRVYHDYCVLGAGPGGLQMGYFLESSGRDYIVFEKSNTSGNFYTKFPRHRKLISLNKRHTGQVNAEFNLRHDWNSLLSDDPDLLMTKYSREMFPHADVMVKYLNDYQTKLGIKVQYNTNISNIQKVANDSSPDGHVFTMDDNNGVTYMCRTLVIATGLATPFIPSTIKGAELLEGYETMSIDPNDFEGKSVLILGRGNSAYETAQHIYGSTNYIHMIGRSRARLSWETHYVGDLRGVNNELLDTYMLKSLDGMTEDNIRGDFTRQPNGKLRYKKFFGDYDVIIRALGFTFDDSVFNDTSVTTSRPTDKRTSKYPDIRHNYESTDHPGMFYAGTATHSLDFRQSAGGFIHGFRYTARALHHLLEWRYQSVAWPSVHIPVSQLLMHIIKRVNEASGAYQMFGILGDVAIFSNDHRSVTYLQEYPVHLVHELPTRTGHNVTSVLVILLEYGHEFSGAGKDVFHKGRVVRDPEDAHDCNFLHPVLYYYTHLPTERMMESRAKKATLPRPDALHHIVEDFHTSFTNPHDHILPLRRFLEHITDTDLRGFFSQTCFQMAMTTGTVPETCGRYMAGQGLGDNHLDERRAEREIEKEIEAEEKRKKGEIEEELASQEFLE